MKKMPLGVLEEVEDLGLLSESDRRKEENQPLFFEEASFSASAGASFSGRRVEVSFP